MNRQNSKTANIFAALLLVWGCSAMIGEIFHLPTIKGLGLATCAAPYTKVFCQATSRANGIPFETFAADFTLEYQQPNGTVTSLPITPEMYQNLRGPYQRRNVYGAVLAYGPALPQKIQQATFSYALESPGLIRGEFGIPDDATHVIVKMKTTSRGPSHQWILQSDSTDFNTQPPTP